MAKTKSQTKAPTNSNANKLGPVALMVSLTPLMVEMAEAAGLDLVSGRFKESSPAGKLTAQRQTAHSKDNGSDPLTEYGSIKGRNQHPLEPGLLELVGLFFLPWATAFISDLEWAEVRELAI